MIGPPLPKEFALSRFIYSRWPVNLGKELTPMQVKILEMKKAGHKQASIAKHLAVQPSTVYTHLTCIRAKGFMV